MLARDISIFIVRGAQEETDLAVAKIRQQHVTTRQRCYEKERPHTAETLLL